MNSKTILAAASLLAAAVASPAAVAAPVVTPRTVPVYYSLDQKSFDAARKGYVDLSFPFAAGVTQLSDPYTVGSTGVTFGANNGLLGVKDARYNSGNAFLVALGDFAVTYTGPVLGLTLESATTQTLGFTLNGLTTGSIKLVANTPTFFGVDNSGLPFSSKIGTQIVFDTSGCSDAIAVVGFQVAAPEAATWAMMMVGLGLAGAALRRRRAGAPAAASFA